jgi:hypothetical protein
MIEGEDALVMMQVFDMIKRLETSELRNLEEFIRLEIRDREIEELRRKK